MEIPLAPTQIVILGGSGDLSKRKLLPALFDLHCKGNLPQQFQIIGFAKTNRSQNEYHELVRNSLQHDGHDHTEEEIDTFLSMVRYVAGSFSDTTSYDDLQEAITAFQNQLGMCTNKLFYLAVPPDYYENIFQQLSAHKLNTPCNNEHGWTRLLVEKPFGHDLMTAQKLDQSLSEKFTEEQIFRIDHYLAKEAVQNILSFRFANVLTRGIWNNQHIEAVSITMKETIDVDERASLYDRLGALRDVGQNHLLQLLALTTMNEPKDLTAKSIREARAEILEKLHILTPNEVSTHVQRAQYEGYQQLDAVENDSSTETCFSLTAELTDPNWKGVPITISTGKALDENLVAIEIIYKDVATGVFETDNCHTTHNSICLTISPQQEIAITLNAKSPGFGYQLETRTLHFSSGESVGEIKNSYQKVLFDCIAGDQTLFTNTKEVLAAWEFITPILQEWGSVPLQTYQKGSAGPDV